MPALKVPVPEEAASGRCELTDHFLSRSASATSEKQLIGDVTWFYSGQNRSKKLGFAKAELCCGTSMTEVQTSLFYLFFSPTLQEYEPTIYHPKRSTQTLHQDFTVQCEKMDIPFLSYLPTEVSSSAQNDSDALCDQHAKYC